MKGAAALLIPATLIPRPLCHFLIDREDEYLLRSIGERYIHARFRSLNSPNIEVRLHMLPIQSSQNKKHLEVPSKIRYSVEISLYWSTSLRKYNSFVRHSL
jgi:hypothetical protein